MEPYFYLDFENKFRGSRDQVSEILSNYDGLIEHILEIDQKPTLLDIGCGRGEWIHKCSGKGFKSCGIELNSEMVDICKSNGLNIIQGDAISVLRELPDNSFSLITCFHMVEHINFDSINEILLESKRILKEEGILVLETPSIDNLSISSRLFYIDPTHINPINSDLISFMLKRIGYDMVKVFYINGGPLQDEDKYSITRILNGVAQDLTIIATSSGLSSSKLIKNNDWQNTLNIGVTTIEACIDFDNQLRAQRLENEERIRDFRARINQQERNLSMIYSSPFYKATVLFQKCFAKCILSVKKIKSIFLKFIIKFSNLSLRLIYKILKLILSKNYNILYTFFRLINKLLNVFGYVFTDGKLLRKSLKIKEELEYIEVHVRQLDSYYKSSTRSQKIYKDLK